MILANFQTGCGATCDRIGEDRDKFLSRPPENTGTHMEMVIPFAVVEGLIAPHIVKVKPVPFKIPNLGQLADYFGELTVIPTKVALRPASPAHIGFRLDFEVRRNGRKAFGMFMETEVKPDIDITSRTIGIGFTPEALQKATPGLSKDAAHNLTEIIYDQIPSLARLVIPRDRVQGFVDSTLKNLVGRFYPKFKDRLLPALSSMSRFEIALPAMPLARVDITSADDNGGHVRLAVTSTLPVDTSLPQSDPSHYPKDRIAIRLPAATAAEIVNWTMAEGLVPDRYNDKGKPKKDGTYRPGLAWVSGDERPMKVYLWDLEKPCMRLTLSAKPSVAIKKEKLVIKAEGAETDDITASAFTHAGVWFYTLWKDPMNLNQKRKAKMTLEVAGQPLEAALKAASLEKDVFTFDIQLSTGE